MSALHKILKLPDTATDNQVQTSYNFLRADLISRQNAGEDVADLLQQLEQAYIDWEQSSPQTVSQALISVNTVQIPPKSPGPKGLYSQEGPNLSGQRICFACGAINPAQANVCINCGKQISRSCPKCGYAIGLEQQVCLRCGTVVREYDQRRFAEGTMVSTRVQNEREEEQVRVQNLEVGHNIRAALGVLFWAAVVIATLFLCYLAIFAYEYFSAVH